MSKKKTQWRIPASRSQREKNCSKKQKSRERLSKQSENVSSGDDWEPSQCTSSHQRGAVTSTPLKHVRQSVHSHVSQEAGSSHALDPPVCITRGADSRRRSSCLHRLSNHMHILSASILMDETIIQQLLGPFYAEESAPVLILQRQDQTARSRVRPKVYHSRPYCAAHKG
ncbi:hypothetical protein PR048_009750 [Dryococelus australis]|uniref:Uncharacterized protein n=1 Tax=Dryococelus australis TaxID=614101 RepID=A0ABQ9I163_9NEOP|nr:hypothetical protein PR048_009750 [Dryococelus australis]